MLFGLSNAPATFQGYVNKILAKKLDIFVIVYLDDILIYTKDPGQPHIEAIRWVLDQLRKYSLFAILKKYCFYQDKICFLGYIVSSKDLSIEAKKIKIVKEWPEPKSVQDIQVFLGFANFYQQFIQDFYRIATRLTSMLKMVTPPEKSILEEIGDGKGGDSIGGEELAKKLRKSSKGLKLFKLGNSKGKNLAKSKKLSKSGNSPNFNAKKAGSSFLTPKARATFNRLQLAFIEALIL